MYFREKISGGRTYLQIVESRREGDKPQDSEGNVFCREAGVVPGLTRAIVPYGRRPVRAEPYTKRPLAQAGPLPFVMAVGGVGRRSWGRAGGQRVGLGAAIRSRAGGWSDDDDSRDDRFAAGARGLGEAGHMGFAHPCWTVQLVGVAAHSGRRA